MEIEIDRLDQCRIDIEPQCGVRQALDEFVSLGKFHLTPILGTYPEVTAARTGKHFHGSLAVTV
jgi:hypothetical protein